MACLQAAAFWSTIFGLRAHSLFSFPYCCIIQRLRNTDRVESWPRQYSHQKIGMRPESWWMQGLLVNAGMGSGCVLSMGFQGAGLLVLGCGTLLRSGPCLCESFACKSIWAITGTQCQQKNPVGTVHERPYIVAWNCCIQVMIYR